MPKISDFPNATTLDGTELVPVVQDGEDRVAVLEDLVALAALEGRIIVKHLDATQQNDTTTPASITEFEQVLEPGSYKLKGLVPYQAAATGTGMQMFLNCDGGTVSLLSFIWWQVTTGTAAASGVGDGATTSTAQLLEGKAQRVNNTPSGATQGVDTANENVLAVLEGLLLVTAQTTLKVMFNSSAASAVTLQIGSHLVITKAP